MDFLDEVSDWQTYYSIPYLLLSIQVNVLSCQDDTPVDDVITWGE